MKAFIGMNNKEIALTELADVPRFLRFDRVSLVYPIDRSKSIAQARESFRGYLSSIKATLNDANIICFVCKTEEDDPSQFSDHSPLLEHIRHIVSICDSSRGYSFRFCFHAGMCTGTCQRWRNDDDDFFFRVESAFGNAIASILEMPEIARSSTVSIYNYPLFRAHLPVEAISNWLNRERHPTEQNQRERNLALHFYLRSAQNVQEMFDSLKQVSFLFPNI